jgi:hypothetical protein
MDMLLSKGDQPEMVFVDFTLFVFRLDAIRWR